MQHTNPLNNRCVSMYFLFPQFLALERFCQASTWKRHDREETFYQALIEASLPPPVALAQSAGCRELRADQFFTTHASNSKFHQVRLCSLAFLNRGCCNVSKASRHCKAATVRRVYFFQSKVTTSVLSQTCYDLSKKIFAIYNSGSVATDLSNRSNWTEQQHPSIRIHFLCSSGWWFEPL